MAIGYNNDNRTLNTLLSPSDFEELEKDCEMSASELKILNTLYMF